MLLVFLTRALITGGYQAAFVYTPEVSLISISESNCCIYNIQDFGFLIDII